MTTRNWQSGEKKQTSARDTREPKPRIGVKEEQDIKSRRRRTQPADIEERQSRLTCDARPRAHSNAREAFSSAYLKHDTETRSQPATGARQAEKLSARG